MHVWLSSGQRGGTNKAAIEARNQIEPDHRGRGRKKGVKWVGHS